MGLHLDRELIVAAYEMLRLTRPFKGWKLPPSNEVGFRVIKTERTRGTFHFSEKTGKPTIEVSRANVGTLSSLIYTVAHEMVHFHEDTAHRARGDVMHGARFKKLAAQVCRHHTFDPLLF